MTTLVLKTVGSVVGGALFGPLGAAIGGALGAIGGYQIDQTLFGSSRSVEGPSLSDLTVQSSTEGASIPRLYGRARLTGQVIWATNFIEEVSSRKHKTGASKGGSGASTTETTYSYFANFAVGLQLNWVRSDRLEADSWADSSIPLSETEECYTLTVRHPETAEILRAEEVNEARWIYSASAQMADGVDKLAEIIIDIDQISRRVGAGGRHFP